VTRFSSHEDVFAFRQLIRLDRRGSPFGFPPDLPEANPAQGSDVDGGLGVGVRVAVGVAVGVCVAVAVRVGLGLTPLTVSIVPADRSDRSDYRG